MPRRRAVDRFTDLRLPADWPPDGVALADAIKALNHPSRRALLDQLVVDGPSPVGRLARSTGLAPGSVSHHVRVLVATGFVEPAPELAGDTRESWWRALPRVLRWRSDGYLPGTAGEELAQLATDLNLSYLIDAIAHWRATPQPLRWDGTVVDTVIPATETQLADLGSRLASVLDDWVQECRASVESEPGIERRAVRAIGLAFPEASGHA